jgi:arginase
LNGSDNIGVVFKNNQMDHLTFFEKPKLSGQVSLLGVPIDIGKDAAGTSEVPNHLRRHGLDLMLENLGYILQDLGNIPCPTIDQVPVGDKKAKYLSGIVEVAKQTAAKVYTAVKAGSKVVALGGDHSMSIGTVSGAAAAVAGDIGLIWIDSHGDMNTHENTISGNIHGMCASALMGYGHPELVNVYAPGAKVKKENVLFIGLKDLDQAEIDLIRQEKITAITTLDLMEKGFGYVTKQIWELSQKVKNVWVSLDIDAIDKQYAPATLMATPGGLTYREITNLARYIGRTCPVIGFDIAEQVTQFDVERKTTRLALELISYFLGSESNWYTKYMYHEAKKQED